MLANDKYARAYANALKAIAEHIERCPEAYFGASELCSDDGFDLQVHLERTEGGVIPKVSLRRDSILLEEGSIKRGEERIRKFYW